MSEELLSGYPEQSWHSLEGGGSKDWDPRLPVGPFVLSESIQDRAARLGIPFEMISDKSVSVLVPFVANERIEPSKIIIPSAPHGAVGADQNKYFKEGRAVGIDPAIVARRAAVARVQDIVVGRSAPLHEVVGFSNNLNGNVIALDPDLTANEKDYFGVDTLNEYYHSVDVLLEWAARKHEYPNEQNPLDTIIQRLANEPETVINLYTVDPHMELFLTWISREVAIAMGDEGYQLLNIEANGPEADRFNRKTSLYIDVDTAVELDFSPNGQLMDAEDILSIEGGYSVFEHELGIALPRVPGYSINAFDDYGIHIITEDEFVRKVNVAQDLMRDRYGLSSSCLKYDKSMDGVDVHPRLTRDELDYQARIAYRNKQNVVLEANVDYESVEIAGEEIELTPSAHILLGVARDGITLQFKDGKEWRGNITILAESIRNGSMDGYISEAELNIILSTVESLESALLTRNDLGIIKLGIDFGIGSIGGRFGESLRVFAQDPNVRETGAEFAIGKQNDIYTPGSTIIEVATRVIKPTSKASLDALNVLATQHGLRIDPMAVVHPGWGMIAATGLNPIQAAEKAVQFEQLAREAGLVV